MKLRWNQEEVISFLEMKVKDNTATEREMDLYLDYTYNGEFNKGFDLYTYKLILKQMKKRYYNK